MSTGTGASNLGYGKITPLSNINGNYVNVHNSHNQANFSSNEISGFPGLSGAKNNVDAALGFVPNICFFKGGSKNLKKKIKNITIHYKMKNKNVKSIKNKMKSKRFLQRFIAGGSKKKSYRKKNRSTRKSRTRRQRGGYWQYQNNLPLTETYSLGGFLSPTQSALAAPPPYHVLPNCTNCVDNYNHYTGKGFPSKGH
jgi:hypothetical protein